MTTQATKIKALATSFPVIGIEFGISATIVLHEGDMQCLHTTMQKAAQTDRDTEMTFTDEGGIEWSVHVTGGGFASGNKTSFRNDSAGTFDVTGKLENDLFRLLGQLV